MSAEQHEQDREDAGGVSGIVTNPVDIPSLELEVFHGEKQPFLSAGYTWRDKPHRVLADCIAEIRALRSYILRGNKAP